MRAHCANVDGQASTRAPGHCKMAADFCSMQALIVGIMTDAVCLAIEFE